MTPFIKQITLLAAGLLFTAIVTKAQLKLGSNSIRFDSSAALEIESQKLTLLLPRINDTSKMVKTVKDGSLIYFTNLPAAGANKGLYIRSSGKWNWLAPAAGATTTWSLSGNSGTNSGAHFLGTTDNRPLLFKTNNLTRLFIDGATGNTGLGTSTPAATLHNTGSTLLGVKTLTNFATGGVIGTALNTVDSFTVFSIAQTTAAQTLSLPAPAKTTAGRIAVLLNTGTVAFTAGGSTVNAGTSVTLVWRGAAWAVNGDGYGTGSFTVPYRYLPLSSLGMMEGAAAHTTGANNVAIGLNALQTNTSGTDNIAIGDNTLKNGGNPIANVAIGSGAMANATGNYNVGIGLNALANTAGNDCVGIGASALISNTGSNNTAFGLSALFANTTGSNNTAVGNTAMAQAAPDASNNTAMGYAAAYQVTGNGNTAFGTNALRNVINGSNNTAVGYWAGNSDDATLSAANVSNSTAIGAWAQITNSNTIILGSANSTHLTNVGVGVSAPSYKLHVNGSVAGVGAFVTTSDGRLKKNVQQVHQAIDKIKALRGISFNWNQDKARQFGLNTDSLNHYGFIAQEVEKILPQVVYTGTDPFRTKAIAYADIIPVLTEALKQQQPLIAQLQKEQEMLEQQLTWLEQQLKKKTNTRQ